MTDSFYVSTNPRKVIVTREGIRRFNRGWPNSPLRDTRHYWFEFDTSGNLIDTDCPESDDGDAATAIAADCFEWLENGTLPDWS